VLAALLAASLLSGCKSDAGTTGAQTSPTATPSAGPTTSAPTSQPGTTPPSGVPSSTPGGDVLVTYARTGGLAGFQDVVVVYKDGRIFRKGGCKAKLPAADLAKLRATLARTDFASIEPPHRPPVADGFVYQVGYEGHAVTARTPDIPAELQPVLVAFEEIVRKPCGNHPIVGGK
jgi:hypothetical protein